MQNSERTVVFCGGGSGGHLYPAIAVCEQLRHVDTQLQPLFLTTGRAIEDVVLSQHAWESQIVPSIVSGAMLRRPLRSILQLRRSIRRCQELYASRNVCCVVGLGGAGSIPGVLAARKLQLPILLLEQNVIPGRANSMLSRWSQQVFVSFESTVGDFPKSAHCVVSGNPVRASLVTRQNTTEAAHPRTLLVLGGSQGAQSINQALLWIAQHRPHLLQDWVLVHQTGQSDNRALEFAYQAASIRAQVDSFFEELPALLHQAAFAVSRAGATTLAELAAVGCPAILIPYPNSIRNHQLRNAEYYHDCGAAVLVREDGPLALAAALANELERCLTNPDVRATMQAAMSDCAQPRAAQMIADAIREASC